MRRKVEALVHEMRGATKDCHDVCYGLVDAWADDLEEIAEGLERVGCTCDYEKEGRGFLKRDKDGVVRCTGCGGDMS